VATLSNAQFGEFCDPSTGKPLDADEPIVFTAWDRKTRDVETQYPILFRDPAGLPWRVPAGSRVNGLSVPRIFWRLMPPYAARAREASVLHDHYCATKTRDSRLVHAMFYLAMRANGVGWWVAFTRWLAVRVFGPRFRARRYA